MSGTVGGGAFTTSTIPQPAPGRIVALPVEPAYPGVQAIPQFGNLCAGDSDHFFLDMSAWAAARGGDVATGTITTSITPAMELVASSATAMVGAPFTDAGIMMILNAGSAVAGRTYNVGLEFSTSEGETINRTVRVGVIKC